MLSPAATVTQHKEKTADDDDGDGKQYGESHKFFS
jgi:hypothetical protein